jgi:hypothetical protein
MRKSNLVNNMITLFKRKFKQGYEFPYTQIYTSTKCLYATEQITLQY